MSAAAIARPNPRRRVVVMSELRARNGITPTRGRVGTAKSRKRSTRAVIPDNETNW